MQGSPVALEGLEQGEVGEGPGVRIGTRETMVLAKSATQTLGLPAKNMAEYLVLFSGPTPRVPPHFYTAPPLLLSPPSAPLLSPPHPPPRPSPTHRPCSTTSSSATENKGLSTLLLGSPSMPLSLCPSSLPLLDGNYHSYSPELCSVSGKICPFIHERRIKLIYFFLVCLSFQSRRTEPRSPHTSSSFPALALGLPWRQHQPSR